MYIRVFLDSLLQKHLYLREECDRAVEERIGARNIGPHGQQVAGTLVARIELFKAPYALEMRRDVRLVMAREIDCSMSMAG